MTETIIIAAIIPAIIIIQNLNFRKIKRAFCPPFPNIEETMDYERLKEIFKKIGVQQISANDDKNRFKFKYQGGSFELFYIPSHTAADLFYPNFDRMTYQDFNIAALCCNKLNLKYGGWTCYLQNDEDGGKERPVSANLSYRVSLLGSEEEIIKMLNSIMQSVFHIARNFSADFEKENQQNNDLNKNFLSDDFNHKMAFISNELATGNGKLQEQEQVEEGVLKIEALLKLYDDVDIKCMKSMRIVKGNEMERWDNVQKILEFDLQTYLKQSGAEKAPAEMVLLIELEKDSFIISLNRAAGCTDKTLFYNLTIERTWYEYIHQQGSNYKQNLIEIRLSSANDDYWEAKFMIDDAKDKAKEGKYGDLTAVQQGILCLTNPSIQTDLYWGKKYYLANCYFQSLAYFRRIYNFCRNNWKEMNDEQKERYYEICYYMGFIYMELNCKEKAFYYLDTAKNTNNIATAQAFINCLRHLNDPFTIDCIQSYLEKTNEILADNEENEFMIEFRQFLNRQLACTLIDRKDWDNAETLLNLMIKRGEDVEFAQKQLEYLKHIRDSKQP